MTKRILVFLLLVGVSLCLFPRVTAQAKTDSVEIWVGYFGDTPLLVDTVSESEMKNLECGEWIYSFLDKGGYAGYNLAYGVTVTSLMDYVGISTDDINIIYFTGTDEYSGDTSNRGLYNLFGDDHRYYPYLSENWDQANREVTNISLVESLSYPAPAILAFQQSHNREEQGAAFDEDKYRALMSDEKALRLVFGQTKPTDVTAADSVFWVYKITVTLDGSPITLSNIEMQYGSPDSVSVTELYKANTAWKNLNDQIESKIVVTVDPEYSDIVRVENGQIFAVKNADDTAYVNVAYIDDEGNEKWADQVAVSVKGDGSGSGNPDSGNPDSGNPDSGNPDSGNPDSGNPDSGNPDSGNPDSGNPDSGSPDSGNPDSGNPDSGNPDSGNPDSGNPDSGNPNSGNGGKDGNGGTGGTNDNDGNGGNDGNAGNAGNDGNGDDDNGGTDNGGTVGTDTGVTGTGDNGGATDLTTDDPGAADRIQEGTQAGEENVPLSENGEAVYDQVKDYLEEQLDEMEEVPSTGQITSFTEDVREYIEELIEQAEEEDEPLDMEAILEMVEEYIDELVKEAEQEDAQEDAVEVLSVEEPSEENEPSEEDKSKNAVYLSVGNINSGDSSGGAANSGSMSTGNTSGGSGGQVLKIEPLPIYYTVILIVAIVALFAGGGVYRSLRFRRETAER